MQNDKLLPCPFCGGEAKLIKHFVVALGVDYHQVFCTSCCAKRPVDKFFSEEDAIKHWNTREPMGDVASKVQQVIWDSCSGDEYKYASKEIEKIFDEVYWEGGVDNAG